MASFGHLASRFVGSLLPIGPSRPDAAWARAQLGEGEQRLWDRMSPQDRRHAAGVARRVQGALGAEAPPWALAAALLHDVGKLDSRFGTFGRVYATISAKGAGYETAKEWTRRRGLTRRVGLYVLHPELGGTLLGMAGADPLTRAWAAEHHSHEATWTVPVAVGQVLKAADGD